MDTNYKRPDPYYLLNKIDKEEDKENRGKLKIFFGYSAGVGKTYAMLRAAHETKKMGKDIVIGYIEPHGRRDTMELTKGLPEIPIKNINYNGVILREFDIDKALLRKPEIILVDELAHTNAKSQRNRKRWQDIEELLDAGIDVYTTLNVQHIESLNDIVANITHISVRETIPDKVFDDADKVELIDIEPDELLKRFSDGKVYKKDQLKRAFHNFFTKNNLYALREIALRRTADRVNFEIEIARLSKGQITVMATSDQILACIGTSPSSARIIRTAARMSEVYHSKWIALYVDTGRTLNKADKETLNSNFRLVEQLGGELATVSGENVADQIIRYAELRNTTKIIIGKNHKKTGTILHFYARDVVDKLIDSSSYIDVYMIPNSSYYSDKKKKILPKIISESKVSYKDLIRTILIMATTVGIAKIFDYGGFSNVNEIMIFILGVIIVYMTTTGQIMGIISSFVGVLIFNYMFTEPRNSFRVYDKSYIVTFPIMMIVAFIVGGLTNKVQREAQSSSIREKRTQTLYIVSGKLLSAVGTYDVVSIGIKYISRLVNRNVICYLANNNKLSTPFVYKKDKGAKEEIIMDKDENAAAYWTFLNGKESGCGTNTFYKAKGYYVPIKIKNKILGVIGVSCPSGPLRPEKKFMVETVTSQIAIALDREILSKEQEKSKVEIERERLRSNLLRSISHDLRSPLAGIKGAVSTILENGEAIGEGTKKELLNGIYDDTEWLIRLVENLLSMTRFDEGSMEIKKDIELVEEVISEAVQRSSKYFKDHKIKVNIPENVIMVSMDGSLIEQVIINLLDNASKFSPKGSTIEIKVYEDEKNVVFEVIDSGQGISEDILPNIFDRFFTNGSKISDSRRGVGLGLAICKSIVEAHGGMIQAINSKSGGAIFKFNIPKE
ncbi:MULTISPECIES: sensor histidine kinase [Clostridium]|uniref:sensor histidine kinase n=1 Tax=Clostridium TaxID=1485 RepID=UPI00082718FA|nr:MULTISPECIES: sensor histidine kinase KdpD [Clostridium]PJI08400.1 sensor histidine kinase KdpD [Clostridium sp. CT7]